MSFLRKSTAVAFTCLMAVAAASVHADQVRIDFTGVLNPALADNAFGEPVPELTGYLIYDDSVAGSVFSSTATNYANAIRELSFSIGTGSDVVFSGFRSSSAGFGSAQVQDAPGQDRLSFNNLTFTNAQLQGEPATIWNSTQTASRTVTGASMTVGIAGPATTIAGQQLAGTDALAFFAGFTAPGGSPVRNVQLNLSYDQSGTPAPGSSWSQVSFNYNLQPVSVSAVPLPAAAWLLGSGLLSLGAMARRRRRGG